MDDFTNIRNIIIRVSKEAENQADMTQLVISELSAYYTLKVTHPGIDIYIDNDPCVSEKLECVSVGHTPGYKIALLQTYKNKKCYSKYDLISEEKF